VADISLPCSPTAPKGKQREEQHDSDDATGAAGVAEQPKVHCYAQFTLEKRRKVTAMVQDFFGTLDAYAKEENIDLTAVTKCFKEQLTSMRRSPWQAMERLFCIQREGGSKYFNNTALSLHVDKCGISDVDFESMLNAAIGARSAAVQDEEAGSDEDSDDDESDQEEDSSLPTTSTSTSFVMAAKLKYQELRAKARKYPGAEKRLKAAIIQQAADRMEDYLHDGATDNRRVKAIRDSHEELTQFVSRFWIHSASQG